MVIYFLHYNLEWRWRYRDSACASDAESEDFSSINVSFTIFSVKEDIKLSDAFWWLALSSIIRFTFS